MTLESLASKLDLKNSYSFMFIKGALVATLIYGALRYMKKRSRAAKRSKYPKDVVILHQFPKGFRAPSISPFPIKLETWLRMAQIKYQNDYTYEMSPKGKIPWITFNGIDISDSDFCIKFLISQFNKDLSSHLNDVEKAIARAFFKMNEESTRWAGVIHRFRRGKPEDIGIPFFLFKFIGYRLLKQASGQGYGLHTMDEVYQIGIEDLKAIDTFIGNKKFLMGDQVCNEDASLFGMLCQVVFHDHGPFNTYVSNECPNIIRYVDNIKSAYWPDWNEQIRDKRK